jgi:hypothetical protein
VTILIYLIKLKEIQMFGKKNTVSKVNTRGGNTSIGGGKLGPYDS